MPLPKLLCLLSSPPPVRIDWQQFLSGFEVQPASGLAEAHALLSSGGADAALVAGSVPGVSWSEVLEALQPLDPLLRIIFWDPGMTAADAVRLIRQGAYHCFSRPDSSDALRESLEQAVEDKRSRSAAWMRSLPHGEQWRQGMVGGSRAMQDVVNTIRLVGPRRCTVLISGETGTGKEVAARALHRASPRSHQPMVAVNCSALPEHLLEAELFGHVKGAFTGAVNHRVGRFEQANKGTVFLDEISEMPLELQAKLLRVLQEREIQRLGQSETIKLDVRVVAATNTDLPELVRQGRFRGDLYYRLNVVPVRMPPLRRRPDDIPILVHHFLRQVCQNEGLPVKSVSREGICALCEAQWPGNVRQLENAVEMAVALSGERETLTPADFGLTSPSVGRVFSIPLASAPAPDLSEGLDFDTAVGRFERTLIERALQKTGGNKTAAAGLLGIKRTTLIMKLRTLGGNAEGLPVAV